MDIDEETRQEVNELIKSTLSNNQEDRPDIDQIINRLNSSIERLARENLLEMGIAQSDRVWEIISSHQDQSSVISIIFNIYKAIKVDNDQEIPFFRNESSLGIFDKLLKSANPAIPDTFIKLHKSGILKDLNDLWVINKILEESNPKRSSLMVEIAVQLKQVGFLTLENFGIKEY